VQTFCGQMKGVGVNFLQFYTDLFYGRLLMLSGGESLATMSDSAGPLFEFQTSVHEARVL